MSYTDKAALKILHHKQRPKKGAWFIDGKFMRGTFSTHLSRTGVRYNRLMRLSDKIDLITRKRKFWSSLSKKPTLAEMVVKSRRFGFVFEFDITDAEIGRNM